jgi:membrane protein DedA with SNARE-associated domain
MTGEWRDVAAIVGGTLVSEDLTTIGVGLLVLDGRIDPALGIAACAVGILLGDAGLWAVGRFAVRRAVTLPFSPLKRLSRERVASLGRLLDARLAPTVLATRALPGTRLPFYVAAGAIGTRPLAFAFWTALSVLLWVPLVVLAVSAFGGRVAGPLEAWLGRGWLALLVTLPLVLAAMEGARALATSRQRSRLAAGVSRIWRWEFWPSWLFYAPVVPWVGWLALRYRGLGTLALANPGIPEGGFVGESKFDILQTLPAEWTLPAVRLQPGDPRARTAELSTAMSHRGWTFPVVLKPDVGQRGTGVRVVRNLDEASGYFQCVAAAVVAQVFHPGPFEAGIFYYRMPDEAHGRIFSVTDKRFPFAVGDGRSTLEELVWQHPRLRMQARRFLERLGTAAGRVPGVGERVALAVAGNHAQGTMFLDGQALVTPALERRIDQIARAVPGFFIGRFDVRYADPEAFRAGDDLAIVELNGATSESTNIYDPSRTLRDAYRTLFRQWQLVFRIGSMNRRLGHRPVTARRLVGLALAYLATDPPLATSD